MYTLAVGHQRSSSSAHGCCCTGIGHLTCSLSWFSRFAVLSALALSLAPRRSSKSGAHTLTHIVLTRSSPNLVELQAEQPPCPLHCLRWCPCPSPLPVPIYFPLTARYRAYHLLPTPILFLSVCLDVSLLCLSAFPPLPFQFSLQNRRLTIRLFTGRTALLLMMLLLLLLPPPLVDVVVEWCSRCC